MTDQSITDATEAATEPADASETWQGAIADAAAQWQGTLDAISRAREIYAESALLLQTRKAELALVEDHTCRTPDGASIALRVYRASGEPGRPAMLFAHGGGWMLGSLESHDSLCRALASESGWTVVAVDYRLAPEHPYPTPLDDLETALGWIVEHAAEIGVVPSGIAACGDSAGGNLAAALSRRDRGVGRIGLQLLFYPALDGRMPAHAWHDARPDDLLQEHHHRWFYSRYAGGARQLLHPEVAPALADDLAGLPPAVILVGERDALRHDGELYVTRLTAAGIPAEQLVYPGMQHGFMRFDELPERRTAVLAAAAALLRATAVWDTEL